MTTTAITIMKYPKPRLAALMFIQFFIWGATGPILSLYLRDCLGFTGAQVGLVLGISAIGAIVSPTIMSFIADRVISSERLLCLLNVASGALMLLFAAQTEFYSALFTYILYCAVAHPTMPLINAITFHHAPTDRRKFGNIRVWGTIGWIAVAWSSSLWILGDDEASSGISQLPLMLTISAVSSFVAAAYALTIPRGVHRVASNKTLPDAKREHGLSNSLLTSAGSRPAKVIMQPKVLALSLIAAMFTFLDKMYSFGAAPFLRQAGFAERSIMPAMSLGQLPEIVAMGVLGFMLKRWGARVVLIIGTILAVCRFGACAIGGSRLLIYAGLSVHGLVYTLTMVTVIISLDGFCSDRDRSGVHQLHAVLTGGIGGFIGSYAAGLTADMFTDPATGLVNFGAYWTVPTALAVAILLVLSFYRPAWIHTKRGS